MPPAASEPLVIPDLSGLTRLADGEVMTLQSSLAALRRKVDAGSAAVAGEIARRSAHELGYAGLAQRLGARTPDKLVADLAGMSPPEARAMVTVGESLGGQTPWLDTVMAGVHRSGANYALHAADGHYHPAALEEHHPARRGVIGARATQLPGPSYRATLLPGPSYRDPATARPCAR